MKKSKPLFRPARSINGIWNLVKTFTQTLVFWLVFLYIFPQLILKLEAEKGIHGFNAQKEIGWVFFFLFSVLGILSGYIMSWLGKGTPLPLDCPNELVILGPYKVVRNPMAVAGIVQAVSVGVIYGSFLIIFYALSGAVLWHFIVRPLEERELEVRFGQPYLDYKNTVLCWVPRFRK